MTMTFPLPPNNWQHREQWSLEKAESLLQGCVVIGFSGFTKPPDDSTYLVRAETTIRDVLSRLWQRFGSRLAAVYGSSDAGIDQLLERVWRNGEWSSQPLVGITCPEFLPWVPDEAGRPPVVVEESAAAYADTFVRLLSLLVITGGREHTIRHDLMAVAQDKSVWVFDCAPEVESFVAGKLENAAGVLSRRLRLFSDRTSLLDSLREWEPESPSFKAL